MELKYYSGRQRIQREAILECCGGVGAPIYKPDEYGDCDIVGYGPGADKIEADYRLATAEEQAKKMPRVRIEVAVAGTVYSVICE